MAFFSFPEQILTMGRGYRRPGQFFDLPSAMALGADPTPVAGYGGELPQLEFPPGFREPSLNRPIQRQLQSVPAPEMRLPPIGMTPADLPMDPTRADMPVNPFMETPGPMQGPMQLPPAHKLQYYGGTSLPEPPVFTSSAAQAGWERANQDRLREYADIKAFGGNPEAYEAMMNRPVTAAQAAMPRWNPPATTPVNETGIPGVPSVKDIMNNQLFGMNMDPDKKRLLATSIQEKMMLPLAGLERDRLQGEYGVREAEARRREMLNAQQSQIMQYEMMKFEEANPRATMEDKLRHRDMVAKTRGITIPGVAAAGEMVGPVRPENPIQQALSNNAFKRLEDIFSAGRGPRGETLPFTPTEESASALMSALAAAPEADRSKLVERAIALSAGNPELLKMVARNMARNYMLSSGTRLNSADMMVDAATSGLPFDIRTTGAKGYAALGGVPSVAVLPNNVNIPLHYRDKPSEYSRLGVSGVDRQRIAQENEAAKNFLLAAIQQGLLTR